MPDELKRLIRDIPDFPKQGIVFKDITTLLADGPAFARAMDMLAKRYEGKGIDRVVAVEARGFIFGAPLAVRLNAGFVPVRKKGKLPYHTIEENYELEYGTDTLQMHQDALIKGHKVLVVDDLLATGGTVVAVTRLIEKLGAEVVELAFMIELSFLNGREKLKGHEVFSLIKY